MRRVAALALVAGAAVTAAWLLWPAKPQTDEERIRGAVADMAEKAGRHDVSGVVEHVSEKYRGEAGSRDELKRYLAGYILRSDWVTAVPANVQVALEGDKANVTLVVLMARSPATNAAEVRPESIVGSHYVTATFVKEDEWRVLEAARREARPADWMP